MSVFREGYGEIILLGFPENNVTVSFVWNGMNISTTKVNPLCHQHSINIMARYTTILLIVLLLIGIIGGAFFFTQINPPKTGTTITLYVLGSNLESTTGEATKNLRTIAQIWEPGMVDILIAYGAARKDGWNNDVAITNISLLKQDLADGQIGLDTDEQGTTIPTRYILNRLTNTDMADPTTLAYYLDYAETYRIQHNLQNTNNIIILWSHGYGYDGFGSNKITGTKLTLRDLTTAFQTANQSKTPYDLLIFDACLMASLEAADTVYPYAHYLVASQDLTPLGGLNYTAFISTVTKNPEIDPQTLGTIIVDTYIQQNQKEPKTLSLVDLTRTPAVVDSLNNLGSELTNDLTTNPRIVHSLNRAYNDSQGFGALGTSTSTIQAIDLGQFAKNINEDQNFTSKTRQAAASLITTLNTYILHANSTNNYTAATGITVAAPLNKFKQEMPQTIQFDQSGWADYLTAYFANPDANGHPHPKLA